MEPHQALVDAVNTVKAAQSREANGGNNTQKDAIATVVAVVTAAITQASAPVPAPEPARSTPTTRVTFVSPMPIYVCTTYNDEEGVFPSSFQVTVVDMSPRFRHRGSDNALLNKHIQCTVDLVPHPFPSIYMAGITHATLCPPTFLDRGATDTCVRNRKRFLVYCLEAIEGTLLLEDFVSWAQVERASMCA
jgi:hypothetical protein